MERAVAESIVLLCPNGADVLVLNETASDVWRLIDGTLTLPELVSLLASAYGVEPLDIHDDVARTICQFEENGLLRVPE